MTKLETAKLILAAAQPPARRLATIATSVTTKGAVVDAEEGYAALKVFADDHHIATIARWQDPEKATVTFLRPPVEDP